MLVDSIPLLHTMILGSAVAFAAWQLVGVNRSLQRDRAYARSARRDR